jgi:type IV pilus assembly protein PilN
MIRINLLPYRSARKQENIRFQVNVFIGSIVFVGLLLFWVISMLNGRIDNLNKDIQETNDQVAKYRKINKEIDEIKKALALLEKKIKVIRSLEKDRIAPVRNLDELYSLIVEKRMWYTLVEEKRDNIKISGVALDNQTVADYMTRVEKSEQFHNVKLGSVKHYKLQGFDNINLKQFDINFQKNAPQAEPGMVKK